MRTVPTGRDHEIAEIPPTHCPNGHPLGPGQVIVGYHGHPSGVGRARVHTCRQCGREVWDDPSTVT